MKRFLAALLPLFCLTACAPKAQEYSTDFFAMNTFMQARVLGQDAQQTATAVEQRVNALDKLLSRTREDSEIYRLNHANGAAIETEAAAYVALALPQIEVTSGSFDPTVAPLTDLWGIGTEAAHVPAQEEINQAMAHVGWENIQVNGSQVTLKNGAEIDLGGIAKGAAADECAQILRDAGNEGLLALGGNIYAVGTNNGKPWVVGIADPDDTADYLATVAVQELSVVTSGDYERYFEQDGKRYHHIFNPATGYPADSGLRGVTVIDQSSVRADAMTTALFVMGLEKGMAFCEQNEIAAVFITSEKEIYTTSKVSEICQFSFVGEDKGYTYAA